MTLDLRIAPDTGTADMAGGLRILARAQWPSAGDTGAPPAVPGFILSTFNPLAVQVTDRCLRRIFRSPPLADPQRARRISILLASAGGDRTTARVLAEAVERGERVPPLLFFQSNPNAVLGYIAARWGLAGPVISLSPLAAARREPRHAPDEKALDEALDEALDAAAVLIGDADADEALVVAVDQGPEFAPGAADPGGDRAVALFVAGER